MGIPLERAAINSVLVIDLPVSNTEPYRSPIISTKISASLLIAFIQFSEFVFLGSTGKSLSSDKIGL